MLKAFVAVIIRLTGIYMLVAFGWKVPLLLYTSLSTATVAEGASSAILILLTLAALLFVFIPQRFTAWIMIGIPSDEVKEVVSFGDLQHVIFSGVGLFFVALGATHLYAAAGILLGSTGQVSEHQVWYLFSPVLEVVVGLLMLFGVQGVRGMIVGLRKAGVK